MTGKSMTMRGFGALALCIAMAAPAYAQPVDWQLAPSAGQELTAHLNERLDIQFGVTHSGTPSERPASSGFGALSDEFAFSALVDWSFSDEGLRMRGGARYGDQDPAKDSWQFSAIERENIQTYLGVGWDSNFTDDERFGLSLDMGLAFESVRGTDTVEGDTPRNLSDQTGLGSMFESLRYTPSVSAGLEYRF
ncbi:hypothetical protein FPL11_03280 [Spiribacter aquaticus]|uniref:Porin family protein n=2 Tax=Spiribacter TaxID=1335745 RepID=A0A557RIY8_9GAMM|nr:MULTISPECIES: hypothetical protein [Spiribacter]TVO65132.1 hypothetical protein FPL11_03280 [Spiribacter aquaticus]